MRKKTIFGKDWRSWAGNCIWVLITFSVVASGNATLVVIMPCHGGVVISADSVAMVAGEICPDRKKLSVLAGSKRTLFAVTGSGEFIAKPPPDISVCEWVARAPVLFSARAVIAKALAEDPELKTNILSDLQVSLCNGVRSYFAKDRELRKLFENREILQPVIVQTIPERGVTLIGAFVVAEDKGRQIYGTNLWLKQFKQESPRDIQLHGEAKYVLEHVLNPNGRGKEFLPPEVIGLSKESGTVRDVAPGTAVKICEAVVSATEKTSKVIPIPTGVGGEPTTYFLNGKSEPVRMKKLIED